MMPEVSITGDLNTETTPSRCELLELARVTREQRFGFAFRDFYRTHKTASQQPGASPPGGWGGYVPPGRRNWGDIRPWNCRSSHLLMGMKKMNLKISPFEKIVDEIRGVFNFGGRFGGGPPLKNPWRRP